MRIRLPAQRLKLRPAARLIVTLALLCALLASVAPLNRLALASACAMACCAGLPMHEAGSCAHGHCRTNLTALQPAPPVEPLCGAHEAMEMAHHDAAQMEQTQAATGPQERLFAALHFTPRQTPTAQDAPPQTDSITTGVFTTPCAPDCGAGAGGFANQNRPRDAGAGTYADRPRPPSVLRPSQSFAHPTQTHAALCRRSRPRGPPLYS